MYDSWVTFIEIALLQSGDGMIKRKHSADVIVVIVYFNNCPFLCVGIGLSKLIYGTIFFINIVKSFLHYKSSIFIQQIIWHCMCVFFLCFFAAAGGRPRASPPLVIHESHRRWSMLVHDLSLSSSFYIVGWHQIPIVEMWNDRNT